MSETFLISDLHLSHKGIVQFLRPDGTKERPWDNIEDMNEADFLNFTTGFQDAVNQILEPLDCWTQECRQAYLALKYYGLNLIETGLKDCKFKRTYADLLVNFLHTTQRIFLQDSKTSSYYF